MFRSHFISILLSVFLDFVGHSQQISNYITNGSFEKLLNCNPPVSEDKARGWSGIDSTKHVGIIYSIDCGNAPYTNEVGIQYAKHSGNFIRLQLYCPACGAFERSNLKNRMKGVLTAGKTYCVKMYVNMQDSCPLAIDRFGIYFGDQSIDTIDFNCRSPLTFLSPQIQNATSNFINDTVNWIPITGTFVANGTEKYAVIANFYSNLQTNTISTGIAVSVNIPFSEYFFDAVSCIDIDLPAYAGPDKPVLPGDSVYIGRESDVEIDESCIWYLMTSPTTSITLDTIAGMWVKPAVTSTYVVRQQLWCSGVKWDTVVVFMDAVGISETGAYQNDIKIFPNPASNFIEVEYSFDKTNPFNEILFYNQLGELVLRDSPAIKNKKSTISISKLVPGVYSIEFKEVSGHTVRKRLIVSR